MRILSFAADEGYREARFHSVGLSVTPLARSVGSAVCLRLEPGGVIGRHDAVDDQLFCVIAGSAQVSGTDGIAVTIEVGQAAFWTAGESHETTTVNGVSAIVLEGRELDLHLGRDETT